MPGPGAAPTHGDSGRLVVTFYYPSLPHRWRCTMSFGKVTKFGVGAAALALIAIAGIGFAPSPTQLTSITVHRTPT